MSIVDLKVPAIGESVKEVTLSKWLKSNGSIIKLDEPICEFESDKATLEFPAEASGKLIWVAAEGDDLPIGAVVAQVDTSVQAETSSNGKAESGTPIHAPAGAPEGGKQESYASGHPAPAAAKILKESGIAPESIQGSGKGGRITKADALQASQESPKTEEAAKPQPVQAVQPPERPTPAIQQVVGRQIRREKMSRMRRTIAARLVSAKNTTAMLTTFNEVDLSAVMQLREKYQERFVKKYGIKLGFMSLFAKACAKVLLEMPEVNSHIDGNDLIYHDFVDISVAISTPSGLVVPPVQNVESLSLAEIEWKIKELADKARAGTLSLDEMQGGTFTITNGGIFGSMLSTPILNEPQSAILGMHTIQERPMAINGQVVVRPMMYLALSYDHRVIDGSSAVTFLVKVKQLLEDPITLLMDL